MRDRSLHGESLAQSPEHLKMRERVIEESRERDRKRAQRSSEKRSVKLTLKSMEFALRTHGGNITDAAHFLGTNVTALRLRVQRSEKLQAVIAEVTEELLDYAENVVAQSIFSGNVSTATWYLKMKGKDRGYIEKSVNEIEPGEKFMKSADELIKAMREGRRELEEVDGGEVKWLEPKLLTENQDPPK